LPVVRVTPYVFRQDVLYEKTRISGLPSGVDFLVMGSAISIQSLLACEKNDIQTDGEKAYNSSALGIALLWRLTINSKSNSTVTVDLYIALL